MTYYFIDYENTKENGLNGVDTLGSDDKVIIFLGQQDKSISFEKFALCFQSRATFKFFKAKNAGKNYLDFQLSSYLGYAIAEEKPERVVIISNDSGFDSVVDFWRDQGLKIQRQGVIQAATLAKKEQPKSGSEIPQVPTNPAAVPDAQEETIGEDWRKRVREAVKSDKIPVGKYAAVYKAIAVSQSKTELNSHLTKKFKSEKAGSIYRHVISIFEQYHKKA